MTSDKGEDERVVEWRIFYDESILSRTFQAHCGATIWLAILQLSTAVVAPAQWDRVTEYSLPSLTSPQGGMTTGPDGALWRTLGYFIGRMTTEGVVTQYPVSNYCIAITTGPDGALWFTEVGGIGRITTGGALTEYPVPTLGTYIYGIVTGPDQNLWFTETDGNNIGRITPDGAITEFPMPNPNSRPDQITVGPDGALWFTEQYTFNIGRSTTAGAITELSLQTYGKFSTQGITTGPDGALWFTAGGMNNLARMVKRQVTTYALSVTNLQYITPGPDGALWFTANYTLGRITTTGVVTFYALPRHVPPADRGGADQALWFGEPATFSANVARADACALGLGLSYSSGTLTMSFDIGETQPVKWNAWTVIGTAVTPVISTTLPALKRPHAFTKSLPGIPKVGNVGISSTLSTSTAGLLCSDFKVINTSGAGPSVEGLWRMVEESEMVRPRN